MPKKNTQFPQLPTTKQSSMEHSRRFYRSLTVTVHHDFVMRFVAHKPSRD